MGNESSRTEPVSGKPFSRADTDWTSGLSRGYELATWIYILSEFPTACYYVRPLIGYDHISQQPSVFAMTKDSPTLDWKRPDMNNYIDELDIVDLSRCTSSHLFIPFALQVDNVYSHAIVVVIDLDDGTYDYIDPNGTKFKVKFSSSETIVNRLVREKIILPLRSRNLVLKHVPNDSCPIFGPQYRVGVNKHGRGLCALWQKFIIYWKLKHPGKHMPDMDAAIDEGDSVLESAQKAVLSEFEVFHDGVMEIMTQTTGSPQFERLLFMYNKLVVLRFSPKKTIRKRRTSFVSDAKKRSLRTRRRS